MPPPQVLKGLLPLLRQRRVLYLLFEFWPRGIRRAAKTEAHEVLKLLHACGYVLFDTQTLRLGSDGGGAGAQPLSAGATFRKPNGLQENVDWFHLNDKLYKANFGYWTDMVAVASGEVDFERF